MNRIRKSSLPSGTINLNFPKGEEEDPLGNGLKNLNDSISSLTNVEKPNDLISYLTKLDENGLIRDTLKNLKWELEDYHNRLPQNTNKDIIMYLKGTESGSYYGFYVGPLKDGKPHEKGTLKLFKSPETKKSCSESITGVTKFIGDFKAGYASSGTVYYLGGNIFKGRVNFYNNIQDIIPIEGESTIELGDNCLYKATFKDGLEEQSALIYLALGCSFTWKFNNREAIENTHWERLKQLGIIFPSNDDEREECNVEALIEKIINSKDMYSDPKILNVLLLKVKVNKCLNPNNLDTSDIIQQILGLMHIPMNYVKDLSYHSTKQDYLEINKLLLEDSEKFYLNKEESKLFLRVSNTRSIEFDFFDYATFEPLFNLEDSKGEITEPIFGIHLEDKVQLISFSNLKLLINNSFISHKGIFLLYKMNLSPECFKLKIPSSMLGIKSKHAPEGEIFKEINMLYDLLLPPTIYSLLKGSLPWENRKNSPNLQKI